MPPRIYSDKIRSQHDDLSAPPDFFFLFFCQPTYYTFSLSWPQRVSRTKYISYILVDRDAAVVQLVFQASSTAVPEGAL